MSTINATLNTYVMKGKYQNIYERLILRAQQRELQGYCERHHIIPRCMGGSDDKSNLVKLTPEEHYTAHLLLIKIHPKHKGLHLAIRILCQGSKFTVRNNKKYGWVKKRLFQLNNVVKQCPNCGIEMTLQESRHKINPNRCCSYRCARLLKGKQNRVTKKCKHCNNDFESWPNANQLYCNRECYKKYYMKDFKCIECGKEYKVPNRSRKKFCTKKCGVVYNWRRRKELKSG